MSQHPQTPVPSDDADLEPGQVRIQMMDIDLLMPSPENDQLYRPVDRQGPDHIDLVKSIAEQGILEPLVITADGYILSGHRRHAAAEDAQLTHVPVRVVGVHRGDDVHRFVRLLRAYNRQRVKSLDEKLREAIVEADPQEAYTALIEHRERKRTDTLTPITLGAVKPRSKISAGKQAMLTAIVTIVNDLRKFWPISERTIHYKLLNCAPLRHSSKPDSTYVNNDKCSKDLSDMVTRARLFGFIDWTAISDDTRPIGLWQTHREPGTFVKSEVDGLFKGYWRDLLQSQPDHVEIFTEKMTLQGVINAVASGYTIPTTIGRGFSSIPPRREMLERFVKSGKRRLVVLLLSDFDPEGESIAESFARSMRDDFEIPADRLYPVKVALTPEQIRSYKLPTGMKVKTTSSRANEFKKKHGDHVWELEALPPEELQRLLRSAIDQVIDVDLFNAELAAERDDSVFLDGVRRTVNAALSDIDFSAGASQRGEVR